MTPLVDQAFAQIRLIFVLESWIRARPLRHGTTCPRSSPWSPPPPQSASLSTAINYLINPDLRHEICANLFSSILGVNPAQSSLLLTETLFTLPSIQRFVDELIFEDVLLRDDLAAILIE
ncbi:hypothetical protein M0R45_014836 [Rubus argutus]|uniref:Uncharacterized protein n=1 Tax=Rubus argutus TaxID=59490 RepID=A0AAW1XND6_RUBAR